MKLTTLTNKSLINLQTTYATSEEAIYALADQLEQQGKLHNKDEYLASVFAREAEGPTALGEGLAVPHGKSDAVKEAAFAVATLTQDLKWKGIDEDEDEDVNLIFLIAIPNAEAGSTHMQLLTELTTTLVDDDVREAVLNATTADEIFALLDGNKEKEEYKSDTSAPTIVCVTACPAGIAHTYMAAEYLEKAGKKLGYNVHVEKQGANGIEDRISADQLNSAVACVFAAEVAIKDIERFKGIPRIETPVAEPIRHAERILNEAIEAGKKGRSADFVTATDDQPKKVSVRTELKQALLSGISFAVPLIIAGGTVLAVAVLLAQIFNLQDLYATEDSWLWMYRKLGDVSRNVLLVCS